MKLLEWDNRTVLMQNILNTSNCRVVMSTIYSYIFEEKKEYMYIER